MSKESEKHVDRVLDQISTRLESLTVSGPKLGDLSTLRSHMLRLLDKVSEQEIAATGLRLRLEIENGQVSSLESQLANLNELIEEGKACLRSGEPVRPECGMAPALLPEVENELSLARNAASAANGQLLAVTNQIDTLRSQYARMIGQVALDARMAHVQALLDTAMQQAAELGLELANNHQFSAAIRVDNRLAILGRNNGMLSSLRNYQGSSR